MCLNTYTDWNNETELCKQWLSYKIDWFAKFLTFGKDFFIDTEGKLVGFRPGGRFGKPMKDERGWLTLSKGSFFCDKFNQPRPKLGCLTFEQWKEKQNESN